jgi:hypothetical protein
MSIVVWAAVCLLVLGLTSEGVAVAAADGIEEVTPKKGSSQRQFVSTVRTPATTAVVKRTPTRDELDKADLKVRLEMGQSGADITVALRRYSRTPEALRTARAGFGLSAWLDRTFASDPAMRRSFGPRLMQSIETVRQRLTLLADLTQRYPDPPGQMSAATRPMLQQLVDLHYRRLRAEMNDSREWVSSLSGAVHVICDPPDTPKQLLACAPVALARAAAFEQLVRRISTTRKDLTAEDQERINTSFAALWQSVHGSLPSRR